MTANYDYYDIAERLLAGTQPTKQKSLIFEISRIGSAINEYTSVQNREINAAVNVLIAIEVDGLSYQLCVPLDFHWTQSLDMYAGVALGHQALIKKFTSLADSKFQDDSQPFELTIRCKNKGLRSEIRFDGDSNNAIAVTDLLARVSDGLITASDHQRNQGMLVLQHTEVNQALREVVKIMISGNNEFPAYEDLRDEIMCVVASKVSALA